MNKFISVFDYKNYAEYIHLQRLRAQRTRVTTQKRSWDRKLVGQQLKVLVPAAKTILCIGARDDSEIEDFERMGYEVCGIDLYSTNTDYQMRHVEDAIACQSKGPEF